VSQLELFALPVDVATLRDIDRTILEAIDKRGSITAREAGRIVYRFRGYALVISVPSAWLRSAAKRPLSRLVALGLVTRSRNLWIRREVAA
jgi:hypothetical protein